jgi:hypothetical protein
MLMRRKHSLDRLLALNASGDLTGSFGTSLSVLERRDAARRRGIARSFFVNGKAVGTIWMIAHRNHRKFDAEDQRLLESMGRFASAAYQTVESIEEFKSEVAADEKAETELHEFGGLERQVRLRTKELEHRGDAFAKARWELAHVTRVCLRRATVPCRQCWDDVFNQSQESGVACAGASAKLLPSLQRWNASRLSDLMVMIDIFVGGTGGWVVGRGARQLRRHHLTRAIRGNCLA